MAQVNLSSPKQFIVWIRIQYYPGCLLNKQCTGSPFSLGAESPYTRRSMTAGLSAQEYFRAHSICQLSIICSI